LTRLLVLVVAALFVVGLAYLTLAVISTHGLTLEGIVSIFVVVVLSVGIFGALLTPPRR
jgi:hypothetical protein